MVKRDAKMIGNVVVIDFDIRFGLNWMESL